MTGTKNDFPRCYTPLPFSPGKIQVIMGSPGRSKTTKNQPENSSQRKVDIAKSGVLTK